MKFLFITLVALVIPVSGEAKLNGEWGALSPLLSATPQGSLLAHKSLFLQDGLYRFQRDTVIPTQKVRLNGALIEDDVPVDLSFSENETVAVRALESGELELTLLVAEEEQDGVPDTVYLTMDEFAETNLAFIRFGDKADLLQNFSSAEETQEANRGRSRARSRLHWGGAGGCVAYVLRTLGFVVRGNGKDITRALIRQKGWRPVSCQSPTPGTVASWKGGSHGRGHTGIWNGSCFAYDIGCGDPGRKYRLIGCAAAN
jgi:hypothetical protein